MSERGPYIAFEGIEGAGKSTIAARVVTRLAALGHRVTPVREPGGTPTGERIRRVLLDDDGEVAPWTEALLFAAARAQLARDVIGPARATGSWVVSDRSVYSSLAYQGGGRGLGVDLVRRVNAPGLGEQWPEMVVLLRIDPDAGIARQEQPDRIGSESLAFQTAVSATFDTLAADEPDRFHVVDASRPVDDVLTDVWDRIEATWLTSSPM
jgi:dTMP kinase